MNGEVQEEIRSRELKVEEIHLLWFDYNAKHNPFLIYMQVGLYFYFVNV